MGAVGKSPNSRPGRNFPATSRACALPTETFTSLEDPRVLQWLYRGEKVPIDIQIQPVAQQPRLCLQYDPRTILTLDLLPRQPDLPHRGLFGGRWRCDQIVRGVRPADTKLLPHRSSQHSFGQLGSRFLRGPVYLQVRRHSQQNRRKLPHLNVPSV